MWPYCPFQSYFVATIKFILLIAFLPLSFAKNNAPTLKLSLSLNEGRSVKAPEDTPVNSLIGILNVHDADSGPAGKVACRIQNDYVGLKLINPNMYMADLRKPLDREKIDTFSVLILCSDSGVPPMTSTAVFSIIVGDKNDNAPKFSSNMYITSIPENEAESSKLNVNIKADDADLGENGEFEYSLEQVNGDRSDFFEIDPEKGDIYTLVSLDHEEFEEINLIVHAMDFGIPPLSSSALVKINVLDLNDNYPTIVTEEMHVREGLPPMSVVGKINATDADSDKNGEVRYSMADSSSIPPFIIGQDGTVQAAVPLDRELRSSYTIYVNVTDQGTPQLSNVSAITISVLDINDNPPIIVRPEDGTDLGTNPDNSDNKNSSSDVSINFSCPEANRSVYQAYATDKDEGENGRVTYAITSINGNPMGDDSLFTIDYNTGRIDLHRCVRETDYPTQILALAFRDNGDPSLEVIATLNVTLDVDFSSLTTPIPTTKSSRQTTTSFDSATSCFANSFLLTCGLVFYLFYNGVR